MKNCPVKNMIYMASSFWMRRIRMLLITVPGVKKDVPAKDEGPGVKGQGYRDQSKFSPNLGIFGLNDGY